MNVLVDAWLKVVGAFTSEDMKLLKARGCASEAFEFLDALDKLTAAWQRAELGPIHKRDWDDFEIRLGQLRDVLREGQG